MRRGLAWAALLACHCSNFGVDSPNAGGMAGGGTGGGPQGGGGSGPGGYSGSSSGGQSAQKPVLFDDLYTLLQGEQLTVPATEGVLSNDRPLNLSVRGKPRPLSSPPEALEPELTLESDGSLSFRPKPGFFGLYGIEYTAQNELGQSAVARLWFRVLPTRISLSVIESGWGGYVLSGSESGRLGTALAAVGDLNGDQRADLLVGAPDVADGSGAAFLVYGKDSLDPIELQSGGPSDESGAYTVFTGAAEERLGSAVAALGDVDRDNLPDFVLGASAANAGQGRAYVVAGRTFPSTLSLPDPGGMVIEGDAAHLEVGRVVAGPADVDRDGIRDVLISSHDGSYGWLHVVFGGSGRTGAQNLSELPGVHLRAASPDDVFPNAAVPIQSLDESSGSRLLVASDQSVVLVGGDASYPSHTGLLGVDGSGGGYRLSRTQPGSGSVASLGDVDADGEPDLGYCDGQACRVVLSPLLTLANAWELTGFSRRTRQVQMAGSVDFDGDGFSDIVLAEPSRVSVVYGRSAGHVPVDVGDLGSQGYRIDPSTGATGISAVSVIGDVNLDGAPDLAVADAGREQGSGRVYVVFGVPRVGPASE